MLTKFGFHTFLFSLLPVLFLFQYNIHELQVEDIIIPLLFSLGITTIAFFILKFFVGYKKSSLLVSWFLILFSIHGNLHIFLLTHDDVSLNVFGKNIVLGPIFLTIFIVGIISLIKTKSLDDKTSVANVMALTIVLFLGINIAAYVVENPVDLSASGFVDMTLPVSNIEKKPDVYLFLLDEYAGKAQLKEDFNYDLSNFENELKQRGLLVPEKSYSNYPTTLISEAALLNMNYFDFLTAEVGPDSKDRRLVYKIIDQNNVMKLFKKNGYKITSFYGGEGAKGDPLLVDTKLCNIGLIDYDLLKNLVNTYVPISYFNDNILFRNQYEKLECAFTEIPNFEKDNKIPNFYYAHLLLPHAPYIYNEQGERVTFSGNPNDKNAYLEQLIFTNKKMLELIDSIQSRSPDSVIIIVSDHGYRPDINWENPKNIDYIRGFNIIHAFYYPDKEVELPDDSSNVNVFRIFFNLYFDTDYEILENRHIWYLIDQPYNFIEISPEFKK
jgi:hypothetical protein